jgi:protein-S-isoprenylcysteine O-methyltransferase Ste14
MWWFFLPSKKPTPAEYAVLVVFSSAVFVIVGVVALVIAIRAPAEKHELAVALAHRGFWCLGIGAAIALAYWLFRRLKDY